MERLICFPEFVDVQVLSVEPYSYVSAFAEETSQAQMHPRVLAFGEQHG